MVSKKTSIVLLVGSVMLLNVIGLLIGPIPQPQAYHNFADQRNWLEVANVWNVLSNITFALAGVWGLFLLFSKGKIQFVNNRERWLWVGVSIGFILTALGSSYYHLMPNNSRLVWDRLPMTIIFMSYVAALIGERINIRLGLWLWPLLLCIGFYSVLYWYASELREKGDLRIYLGVQAFTLLATVIMLITPSLYNRRWDLAVVVFFFGLARFFEIYDLEISMFFGGIVSGHTLKHLAGAMAGFWLLRMIWKRKMGRSIDES